MRQKILNKYQAKVSAHLKAHNQRIFPLPVRGIFNFRCHQNCVQWVKDHPDEKFEIVECIYLHAGDCENTILHYLLKDSNGRYLEVTTGYEAEFNEYYFVRIVPEVEYCKLPDVFANSLDTWLKEFTNPLIRWFFKIDRIL